MIPLEEEGRGNLVGTTQSGRCRDESAYVGGEDCDGDNEREPNNPGSLSSITVMVMVIWTTESGASGVAARVHVVYYSRHGMHGYCARQYICVAHHLLFSQGSLVSQIRNQSSSTSSSAHRGVSAISPCSPLAARPLASPNPAAGQESWPGAVHIDHTHCSCPLGGAIMSS